MECIHPFTPLICLRLRSPLVCPSHSAPLPFPLRHLFSLGPCARGEDNEDFCCVGVAISYLPFFLPGDIGEVAGDDFLQTFSLHEDSKS